MRTVFRILGIVLLALAMILLVSDGTRMLADTTLVFTPLGQTIEDLFPGALAEGEAALDAIHPLLWTPAITTLISWPGWAVLGGLGVLFALAGRNPSRRRLVSSDQF